MANIETRVSALELLFIKSGDWLEPGALAEMSRSVQADLDAAGSDEEINVCRLALSMIQTAHARIRPPLPDHRMGQDRSKP
jgi:hypothetical protein